MVIELPSNRSLFHFKGVVRVQQGQAKPRCPRGTAAPQHAGLLPPAAPRPPGITCPPGTIPRSAAGASPQQGHLCWAESPRAPRPWGRRCRQHLRSCGPSGRSGQSKQQWQRGEPSCPQPHGPAPALSPAGVSGRCYSSFPSHLLGFVSYGKGK